MCSGNFDKPDNFPVTRQFLGPEFWLFGHHPILRQKVAEELGQQLLIVFDQAPDRLNIERKIEKPFCGDDGCVGIVLMAETERVFNGDSHGLHLQS